jgi:hypothetical protein
LVLIKKGSQERMRVRCRINQEDRTRPGASSVGYCITAAAENFVELKAGPITDRASGFSLVQPRQSMFSSFAREIRG